LVRAEAPALGPSREESGRGKPMSESAEVSTSQEGQGRRGRGAHRHIRSRPCRLLKREQVSTSKPNRFEQGRSKFTSPRVGPAFSAPHKGKADGGKGRTAIAVGRRLLDHSHRRADDGGARSGARDTPADATTATHPGAPSAREGTATSAAAATSIRFHRQARHGGQERQKTCQDTPPS
jgi:hypothetical protein